MLGRAARRDDQEWIGDSGDAEGLVEKLPSCPDDQDPADLVRHVVSRVGTVLMTTVDRYDGARVHDGNVVFGAAHRSHLVTLLLGPDVDTGRLALRLIVTGNVAARWAVLVFPVVVLATVLGCLKLFGGGPAVLLGLLVGTGLGIAAAYGAFNLVRRLGIGSAEDRGGAVRVSSLILHPLRSSLGSLGIELEPSSARLAGFDAHWSAGRGADDKWNRQLSDALGALT